MEVYFKNNKLAKCLNEEKKLLKEYGPRQAKKIRIRLAELSAAQSLMDFWPPHSGPTRCHELSHGRRKGQFSVDLDHPYRLIFKPDHDPVPTKKDGGVDWGRVTAILIVAVEDTHE